MTTTSDFVGMTATDRSLHLRWDVPDAPELLRRQRERLAGKLAELPEGAWRQPTRCHLWDVADVVAHLTDTNRWALGALAHSQDPSQPWPFEGFDNRITPHERVVEARGRSTAELLDDLQSGTETVAKVFAGAADPDFPAIRFALARFQAPYAILHMLWDSFLHERDVLLPLGLGVEHPEDELAAVTGYAMLFSAAVMGPFEPPVSVSVVLEDRVRRSFCLTLSDSVLVEPLDSVDSVSAYPVAGPTLATLDALGGRGSLTEVLEIGGPGVSAEMTEMLRTRFVAVPTRLQPPPPS